MWFWKEKTSEDYLKVAATQMQRGDFNRTIEYCDRAIQLSPYHFETLTLRGDAKRCLGDYIGALSDVNQVLAYLPESPIALMVRLQVYLDRHNHYAALLDLCALFADKQTQYLEELRHINPEILGDPSAILAWLSWMLDDSAVNPLVYVARALALLQFQEVEMALSDLDHALKLDPNLQMARLVRGQVLLLAGQAKQAEAELMQLIERNKHCVQAHLLRGQARADLGDYDGARADFSRVTQLAPMLAEGYTKLAAIHSIQGRFDDVLTYCNAAIHLNPSESEAYCYRAVVRRVHGDLAESIADCIQALQVNPNDHLPYMVRAMTYIEAEKLDYAMKDADTAVQLAPTHSRPYLTRGLVWHHKKDFEQANADMSEAIRLDPNFADGYLARAEMRKELGDLIGALHDYQHLLEQTSGLVDANDLEEEIIHLRRAISRSMVESLELESRSAYSTVVETISQVGNKLIQSR
ncbi:MAG: tetratricopeptide repeat protein [Caldilineaceae bacterium]